MKMPPTADWTNLPLAPVVRRLRQTATAIIGLEPIKRVSVDHTTAGIGL